MTDSGRTAEQTTGRGVSAPAAKAAGRARTARSARELLALLVLAVPAALATGPAGLSAAELRDWAAAILCGYFCARPVAGWAGTLAARLGITRAAILAAGGGIAVLLLWLAATGLGFPAGADGAGRALMAALLVAATLAVAGIGRSGHAAPAAIKAAADSRPAPSPAPQPAPSPPRLAVVPGPAAPAPAAAPPATAPAPRPDFVDRLPEAVRGMVLALEAEDHYLRVYTDRGTARIFLRMRDALGELPADSGTAVHRSWWVAHIAMATLERDGRNHNLRLINGLIVPVSRDRVADLRERGLGG
ncbi:hypothetical protein GVO57_07865 [Sphingomonas changnyeongensis]|uniref:HTH LytTR-type domain-containing protein n=1 Tax=Sphingomonas changnyeongensis TaxID=2698679 RepID=A0A7Z2S5W0_9SPHN|nr:LytTR family DNA-binding domain-containing protein [Sphingomonas changnyeongensis]QHL90763.1 hypothetical protein GVO57_07865 [Sphingomonas changnyeongensis]